MLPTAFVPVPTVPPPVIQSVAPDFDSSSQALVTIPPDNEVHGPVLYYEVRVAVACNGLYSNGKCKIMCSVSVCNLVSFLLQHGQGATIERFSCK